MADPTIPDRPTKGLEGPGSDPRFSVVIPTYNRADMVADAIDSVLGQTYPRYEIIVVDDGSTDGTGEVLAAYGDRIRAVRQPNGGLAAARNRGIRECCGELVVFLDSDDMLEPPFLEKVLATFHEHPGVGAVSVAEREFVSRQDPPGRLHTKRTEGLHFDTPGLVFRDTGVGSGRPPVVLRSWLDRLGGFNEEIRCAVDCEMWVRYSFHMPMVLLAEPCIRRRIHPGNLSGNRAQDARDWLRILEWIRSAHPAFVEEHAGSYARALSKQHVRLGRELMVAAAGDRRQLALARSHLWRAIRWRPLGRRGWGYLVWSLLAPSSYARWRSRELSRRAGPKAAAGER